MSEPVYTAKPPRIKPPPALVTAVGVGVLVATVYPLVIGHAIAAFGIRPVAIGLFGVGIASYFAWNRTMDDLPLQKHLPFYRRKLMQRMMLALPLLALTGEPVCLRLIPAVLQLLIAGLFLHSLRGGGSIFYDAARTLHPYAPDFIAPYCRKSTAVFAGVFVLQGLGVTWLAFHPPASGWGTATGLWIWTPVMAASLVDWCVRKWWVRYCGPGPLDQLLKRVLPPENTEAGRRSLAYIRKMRADLGMPPP